MIDTKKVFFQPRQIKEDVYLRPPAKAQIPKTHRWKLLIAAYGLNNAVHEGNQTLTSRLYVQQSFECVTQHCIFYSEIKNSYCIVLLIFHIKKIFFKRT